MEAWHCRATPSGLTGHSTPHLCPMTSQPPPPAPRSGRNLLPRVLNSGPNLTALQLHQMVNRTKYLNPQTSPFSRQPEPLSQAPNHLPCASCPCIPPHSYPNHHSGPIHPAPLATPTTTQAPAHLPHPIASATTRLDGSQFLHRLYSDYTSPDSGFTSAGETRLFFGRWSACGPAQIGRLTACGVEE